MTSWTAGRSRVTGLGLALLAALSSGCGGASRASSPSSSPAGLPVAVSVQRPATGPRLETGFVGFSYEKSRLNLPLFNTGNTGLVALFRFLGPGILRVGGNSVDKTTWDNAGLGLTSGKVAPPDVDRLAGFLKASNWRVIYGLNFATNTPSQMADEAAYAANALGASLYGFELGNEPDLYHSNGLRPTTYTYSAFLAEWRNYAAALQAKMASAVFTGPASAYNTSGFTSPFAKDQGSALQLLTQHYYRADGQLVTSTVDLLLSPDPNLPGILQALKQSAAATPGGYRLAEANSFYNGGAPNVSDAYGTALWAIDFLFTNALNGSSGVNFHGGGNSTGYTPIADDGTHVVMARPEYYGLALVAMAAPGRILTTMVSAGTLSFSAYAVAADDGTTALVLVNKDRAQTATVTTGLGVSATSANLTVLTGTSLDSPTGTLLNGAAIGADGSWSPQPSVNVGVVNSSLILTVPPATAVLARIR